MPRMTTLRRGGANFGFLSGIGSVGTGVMGAGLCTYFFLSLAGRVLGPVAFAPISTLWALVFIVGPGLFLPLQQELGRVIGGQRGFRGGAQVVRQGALLAGVVAGFALLVCLVLSSWLTHALFAGQESLFWCFEGSVVAYAASFVVRGVLSGLGDFRDFGRLIAYEALCRLAIGGALVLAHFQSALAFGLAIAVAPVASAALVTRLGRRVSLNRGPEVPWRDLTRAFGWLVMGSLLAQLVANIGPIAVQLLAGDDFKGEASRFLGALVVARVSLYLFQAGQATILPNLADLLAQHRITEFRRALRRLTLVCCALVVASTVGAATLGPFAVRILFGSGFVVGAGAMAVLAAASAVFVLAAALSGAAIAVEGHRISATAWLVGCLAFPVGVLLGDDLFERVEIGYLLGSVGAAGVLLASLPVWLRHQSTSGTSRDPGGLA